MRATGTGHRRPHPRRPKACGLTALTTPCCCDTAYISQIRNRLARDHEIANFLARIQAQSSRALHIYQNEQEALIREVQSISTGDPFEEFYRQLDEIREFHKRYPNEPVENLEKAYKKTDDGRKNFAGDIDGMFTGEEAFGRYFDLTTLHDEYMNLPGMRDAKKVTYLQYLDIFDQFAPPRCIITRQNKMTDAYFSYVGNLAEYLENFMRKTKPLEDLDRLFKTFDQEFDMFWEQDKLPGWSISQLGQASGGTSAGPKTEGTGEGVWCDDCEKEFKNDNVYKAHLTGKKHIKNSEDRQKKTVNGNVNTGVPSRPVNTASGQRLKERAIAEREHRVRKLVSAMKTEREDTRVNVERKAGMTDRERQQELAALFAEDEEVIGSRRDKEAEEEEGDEKFYNPLKLPLAWDGKPIPFWLYKLHGLGVEFPCEICGNYVYMGRRAFEKHFSEARHIYGLKCLGITNTGLFREITGIDEATKLWDKIKRDRAQEAERKSGGEAVEEMEDSYGNVMPKKVYTDLKKAGLL